jgi:hypothetical protein
MIFQWDEKNTAHIQEHGVSPGEAEFVVRHAKSPFPEQIPDGKSLVWGPPRRASIGKSFS